MPQRVRSTWEPVWRDTLVKCGMGSTMPSKYNMLTSLGNSLYKDDAVEILQALLWNQTDFWVPPCVVLN